MKIFGLVKKVPTFSEINVAAGISTGIALTWQACTDVTAKLGLKVKDKGLEWLADNITDNIKEKLGLKTPTPNPTPNSGELGGPLGDQMQRCFGSAAWFEGRAKMAEAEAAKAKKAADEVMETAKGLKSLLEAAGVLGCK